MAFHEISITIEGQVLDFTLARRLAEELASRVATDPMLVAWFDGKTGEGYPDVPECTHEPGWLAYAEGHGGCVRVDFNAHEYSLIFADTGVTDT